MNKEDKRFLLVMGGLGLIYIGILVWPWIFQRNLVQPPKRGYLFDVLEVIAHCISLSYLYRLIKANRRGDKSRKETFEDRCIYYAIAGLGLRILSAMNLSF